MAITLDAVTLPEDLQWIDELSWTGVQQSVEYSLDGTLVIQEATKQAGREITLQGGADGSWITRATLVALQAKLVEDTDMTLTIHGTAYTVRWLFGGPPIAAQEVIRRANPGALSDHYYNNLILRFIEV